MKKVLLVFLVILLAPISSSGGTPIEEGANINCSFEGGEMTLEELPIIAANHGYKCDSISTIRKMVFSDGFVLACNNSAYQYKIKKTAGHWFVIVD